TARGGGAAAASFAACAASRARAPSRPPPIPWPKIRCVPTSPGAAPALVDALGPPAPLLVPQADLLYLPRGGLGEIAELHRRRRLEVGDVLLAELDDLALGGGGADLERHEGLGPLAPYFVGDGDDRALEHRGMPRHRLLHLDRGDVLAARDDDVLLPVAQLDVAVGVPDADVAGVEPAAAERFRRRLGIVEVALGHVIADHDDLAQRLAVAGHVLHLLVHHAHEVEDGVALPLAGRALRLLVPGTGVPFRVPLAHRVRAVGLGEAVDVYGTEVQLLELAEQGGGRRRRRHRHRDRPGQAMRFRVIDDPDLHGGGAVVVGHALRLEQLPDAAGLDLPQADVRAAHCRHAPGEAPAVAVEHGQRPEVARVEAHARLEHLADRVHPGAAMAVHHPFRPPRGARRVIDRDRLLLVVEPALDRRRRTPGEEILVGIAGRAGVVHADHAEAGEVQRLYRRFELGVHEEELR